ncbi:MAG: DMT family transporter, partial [Bacteroidota bacterium]
MSRNASLLLLHLIVFIFGWTGILGELITLPSNLIVLYRCAIASIALLAFGVFWKKLKPVPMGKMLKIMGVGVITGIHWLLFFESIKVSTVSVGVVILASTALWVALFEPIVTRRKIDTRELVLGLLVIIGVGVIFSVELQYKWGIFLAILSAIFAAMFSVFNGIL